MSLFSNLKRWLRDERGITGLETAIILIAFVVVATVFAFVVLTTGIFSAERGKETVFAGLQKAHFDTTYGTTFPGQIGDSLPDYAAIAEAYGAVGMRVRAADEFKGALEKALGMGQPVVIDVPMRNNPTPTTGHWNILDIYSPEGGKSHVATE